MADEKESILFTLDLDTANLEKHAAKANQTLAKLFANLATLSANSTISSKAMLGTAAAEAELEKRTKSLSNEQLKLEQNTARAGVGAGNLTKGISTLRDAFANNGAKIFGAQIQQFDGLFGKFKGGLDLIKTGMAGIKPAGDTAKTGFDAVKVGIASTGIGLLLLAFTTLITYFTETAEGAKILKASTAALGAVFQVVKDVVTETGKAIVEVFTNPKQAAKDLASFVSEHLVNAFKGFGVVLNAMAHFDLKGLTDGLIQIATGTTNATAKMGAFGDKVSEAAKSAYALVGQQKALVKERRELEIQDVNERSRVDVLLRLSKDRSKSVSERQKLLKEAGEVERKVTEDNIALQQKELELLRTEIALKGKSKDIGDLKQQEGEKRKQIAETLATQNATLATIQAREGKFRVEEAALDKAAASAAKERAVDAANERVAEAERALIMARKKGEETLSIEELIIKRKAVAAELGAKGKGARALIDAQRDADIIKLRTDAAIKADTVLFATEESKIQARLSLVEKGSKEELDLQKSLLATHRDKEITAAEDTIKNQEELTKKILEIRSKFTADSGNLDRAFAVAEVNRQNELATLRLQTDNDLSVKTKANLLRIAAEKVELERKNALALLAVEVMSAEQRTAKINAIEAKALSEKKALDKQVRADEMADEKADIEKGLSQVKEGSRKELDLKKAALHNQQKAELDNVTQTEKEKEAIRAKYQKAEKTLDEDFFKGKFDKIAESVAKYVGVLGQIQEAQIQAQMTQLDRQQANAIRSAGLSAELRGKIEEEFAQKREKLERDAAEKRRRIASVENLISVARGVTDAITKNAGDPFLQVIETALVIATGVAQQQVISAQKFAFGGVGYISDRRGSYVTGPGTGTSDSIPARISNGEAVINAKSTSRYYDVLSKINQAEGGRAFPGATSTSVPRFNHFALGGFLPTVQSTSSQPLDYNQIGRAMAEAAKAIPAPIVQVRDIRDGVSNQVRVENRADI
jgi:hypothetical protein